MSDKTDYIKREDAIRVFKEWLAISEAAEDIIADLPTIEVSEDSVDERCKGCAHYKLTCDLFSEICKYEPTIQTETQNSNLTFEIADTPQTEEDRLREQCRAFIDMVEITKGAGDEA